MIGTSVRSGKSRIHVPAWNGLKLRRIRGSRVPVAWTQIGRFRISAGGHVIVIIVIIIVVVNAVG